jgi:hypothetical protein
MTSVQSAFAKIDKPPTKFFALITPSYEEDFDISGGSTIDLPLPFTLINGVLDINVNQSSSIQRFVTNGTQPDPRANIQGKAFGGTKLVTSFGSNMITYLRNWIDDVESIGSAYTGPLVLYIQPVMAKIQLANPSFVLSDTPVFKRDESWGITTVPPVSGEYIGGGANSNFFTTWIFKTPMTIRYVAPGGELKYITMTSQFAEE